MITQHEYKKARKKRSDNSAFNILEGYNELLVEEIKELLSELAHQDVMLDDFADLLVGAKDLLVEARDQLAEYVDAPPNWAPEIFGLDIHLDGIGQLEDMKQAIAEQGFRILCNHLIERKTNAFRLLGSEADYRMYVIADELWLDDLLGIYDGELR